jgi:hypothetical protein
MDTTLQTQLRRPEANLNVRTARTIGEFDASSFVELAKSSRIAGTSQGVSAALPAINSFNQNPIEWNLGAIKRVFRVENWIPNTRRAQAIPYVPNRVFYSVPTPQLGLSVVKSTNPNGG